MELERTQEAFYELKRHNEVLRASMENLKYESEKILQEERDRQRSEINSLEEEN